MAIVTMKKLRLIGLSSEKKKIIGALLRSGAAELKPTEEIDLTVRGMDGVALDQAASIYSRATVALEFLKAQEKEATAFIEKNAMKPGDLPKEKKSLFSVRESVSADHFEQVVLRQDELLSVCETLENITAEKNELKSRANALATLKSGVGVYRPLDLKFSDVKDTKHVAFLLGNIKNFKKLNEEINRLTEETGADITCIPVSDGKGKVISYVVLSAVEKEMRTALESGLTAISYQPCPYDFNCTAAEKIAEILNEEKQIERRNVELTKEAVKYLSYRRQLQLLADNYRFTMEMVRAEGEFAKTAQTFVLEAFIPAPDEERVRKILEKTTENAEITFEEVTEADKPPTLLKNNAFVAPYESITTVYSPPSYFEADPNPAVAIFYFIFFGIMLGDAGYGLILALACFIVTSCFKLEKDMKSLLLIFGMGGISAIVWGFLFGGVFAIDGIKPVWFIPMNDPITMLLLCFGLGLVQIFVGMGYQAYNLIKEGRAMDAVYDIFSWYVIFGGAGLAAASAFGVIPSLPAMVGLIVLAVGVAVLMFGGAIRAKGFFGRVIGAVSPLYGIVGFFSDVMSYSRLFGLCLASGVIGLVFNTLGGLIFSMPYIGWLLASVIFLLGHTLNFAIGLLGIYVHDSRLQYIEFFGRFYHGGGRSFAPLGLNLKYFTIKQEV